MKKYHGFLFLVTTFILLSGCLSSPLENNLPERTTNEIIGCIHLTRENYPILPAVFENLPSPPACFVTILEKYRAHEFTDELFFSSAFYLQPEFYPSFEKEGMEQWTNPITTHWGAVGYGSTPSDKSLIIQPGGEAHTRFFFHSGFGVRTFQGVLLQAVFENSEDEQWVQVEMDEESQRGFLLGPTFPKFHETWAKGVDVRVRVSPGAPAKTISFQIWVKTPSNEQKEKWILERGDSAYYDATSYVGERTVFRVNVQILP